MTVGVDRPSRAGYLTGWWAVSTLYLGAMETYRPHLNLTARHNGHHYHRQVHPEAGAYDLTSHFTGASDSRHPARWLEVEVVMVMEHNLTPTGTGGRPP